MLRKAQEESFKVNRKTKEFGIKAVKLPHNFLNFFFQIVCFCMLNKMVPKQLFSEVTVKTMFFSKTVFLSLKYGKL